MQSVLIIGCGSIGELESGHGTASIPLSRLDRSTDVANAAVFVADPAPEFVTGVCMETDCGRCI